MESRAKKFGAFGGVFTPSILTILGVIMYMRLGWVVGQTGIRGSIIIILLAHIISVTTGLSISSIATDKKIKSGGIYYMLSRSLGLPMGGAIGIAIFIGTALSISLYIIGFTENFLGIESISDFLNMEASLNSYRLIGTTMVILLCILALISTSLAIKTQYFILGAIALSLISIIAGIINGGGGIAMEIEPTANANPLPLETVFAIFFPAVTGFTAGVAMSGDLKNPGKAIPKGTMAAIVTGFIVYISLALLFGLLVDRSLLLNDRNFLLKVSLFAPLVVAGIWGATLSSALGGILGAPRILQAIAIDKIAPGILSKGAGANNEPRNALILTFVIAEAGILIGELDVIARIVSMFYIAAYGFINLAFALESWASTDFRPGFKVPRWIGVTGFLASFSVMFKIDTLAMIAAFVLMTLLYLLLRRKKSRTDLGDVWQSVWSSLIKTFLKKTGTQQIEKRNWRPNIILFSGGTSTRPYLIDLSSALAGRHGFISNFDLREKDAGTPSLSKSEQNIIDTKELSEKGIFSRIHSCSDIYEGIETIAGTYGFSGIDPDTVMLGWAKQSKNPVRFIQTIGELAALDMNLVLVHYNKEKGFGQNKMIDLWWDSQTGANVLGLHIFRFLSSSISWKKSRLRIFIHNHFKEQQDIVYQQANSVCDQLRITAPIRIISGDRNTIYESIIKESPGADLVILDYLKSPDEKDIDFVKNTNQMLKHLGSALITKPSSFFPSLPLESEIKSINKAIPDNNAPKAQNFRFPDENMKPFLRLQAKTMALHLKNYYIQWTEIDLRKLFLYRTNLLVEYKNEISKLENKLERLPQNTKIKLSFIHQHITNCLQSILDSTNRYIKESARIEALILISSLENTSKELNDLLEKTPLKIYTHHNREELRIKKEDNLRLRIFKVKKSAHFLFSSAPYEHIVNYKKLLNRHLSSLYYSLFNTIYHTYELQSSSFHVHLKNFIREFYPHESQTELLNQDKQINLQQNNIRKAKKSLALLESLIEDQIFEIKEKSFYGIDQHQLHFFADLNEVNPNFSIKGKTVLFPKLKERLESLIKSGADEESKRFNYYALEIHLSLLANKANKLHNEILESIRQKTSINLLFPGFNEIMEDYLYNKKDEALPIGVKPEDLQIQLINLMEIIGKQLNKTLEKFPSNTCIRQNNNSSPESENKIIASSLLADYIIKNDFFSPLRNTIIEITQEFKQAYSFIKDQLRLTQITILQEDSMQTKEEEKEFLLNQKHEIKHSLDSLQNKLSNILIRYSESMNQFYHKLHPEEFVKIGLNLKQYIREEEKHKKHKQTSLLFHSIKKIIDKQIALLWREQSKSLLNNISEKESQKFHISESDEIHSFIEESSPDSKTLKNIPFYYQQLFLGKPNYHDELVIGRDQEFHEFEIALRRHSQGIGGAIFISAEQGLGKSFFLHWVSKKLLLDNNIIFLEPLPKKSQEIPSIEASLQKATGLRKSIRNLVKDLPEKSVIMIDDLELWWRRTDDGYNEIKLINEIIANNKNILFVISSMPDILKLIKPAYIKESSIQKIINLKPLNPEQIKNLIMIRHQSGGLSFHYKNKSQSELRFWSQAALFNKIFSISSGNIEMALRLWLQSIKYVNGNTIHISPQKPNIPELIKHLPSFSKIIILQLFLHKWLFKKDIPILCNANNQDIEAEIQFLELTQLIQTNSQEQIKINPWVYHHIKKHFESSGII